MRRFAERGRLRAIGLAGLLGTLLALSCQRAPDARERHLPEVAWTTDQGATRCVSLAPGDRERFAHWVPEPSLTDSALGVLALGEPPAAPATDDEEPRPLRQVRLFYTSAEACEADRQLQTRRVFDARWARRFVELVESDVALREVAGRLSDQERDLLIDSVKQTFGKDSDADGARAALADLRGSAASSPLDSIRLATWPTLAAERFDRVP